MNYNINFKPRSLTDLKRIPKADVIRIFEKLQSASVSLKGDIKRLTNFTPEYSLRVGKYRVLFEIENDDNIVVYRILPRKDAYKKMK